MSAQTLHKRPPKLHLGHEDKVSSITTSADGVNNPNDFNQCNTAGMSSPSTPTTPSTPSSPAISKPPKKRYLENGSFRSIGDDQTSHNLMEFAKVCSDSAKTSGSLCGANSNKESTSSKVFRPMTDIHTSTNCNYVQTQVTSSAVGDNSCRTTLSTSISSYNQIPIFDVDIAGRIRDSDLFETCSSSPSGSTSSTSNSRPEEPLNLCTDKKTITTCQQDLISRMVDKFFCDPNESKGTLLDSFLLRMNSHKKLPQTDKSNRLSNSKLKDDKDENCSEGEEVECVGSYKNSKSHHSEKTNSLKSLSGNNTDDKSSICKSEKKDNIASGFKSEEGRTNTEQKHLFLKKSQGNASLALPVKMVTTSTSLLNITDTLGHANDDNGIAASPSLKEGQRKSQRSSKGKRYQSFLTQGFLHPKERKLMRKVNSEEQMECEKNVKEVDIKSINKSGKKRKATEIRDDKGNFSTKDGLLTDEISRDDKANCGHNKDDENEIHRLRKVKKKNLSNNNKNEDDKNRQEIQEKSIEQEPCLKNETEFRNNSNKDINNENIKTEESKVCYTQNKSQSDDSQEKKVTKQSSYLNTDDSSNSPPKLTRMDKDIEDHEKYSVDTV